MKAQKAITPFKGLILTPEYQNYLTRLSTGGVTLPSKQRQIIDNDLVKSLLSKNLWNKIYLFQIWCGETKNQLLYNLQNDTSRPSYNDYAIGAFINSGGIFTASLAYNANASEPVDTNFIPNTHLSGTSNNFEIWFSNQTNGINFGWDYGVLGTGITALSIAYQSWNSGSTFNCELQIGASTTDYASADENSLTGIWRSYVNSSAYIRLSQDGVDFGMRDQFDSPTAKATSELYFSSINNSGSPLFTQTREKSFYLITEELNNTEASDLLQCLQDYEIALGI